jgi:hypothetical protein
MAPSISPNSDKVKKRPKVRGKTCDHNWSIITRRADTLQGCYQCSRRRIDCDRKEPECAKCIAKGIKCSGLGLRYRFNDGIAARGKFVGKTLPLVDGVVSKSTKRDDASTTPIHKRQRDDPFRESGYERLSKSPAATHEIVEDSTDSNALVVSHHKPLAIYWGLDHVDPKSRFCLGYCMSITPPLSNHLTSYSLQQHSAAHRRHQYGLQRIPRSRFAES